MAWRDQTHYSHDRALKLRCASKLGSRLRRTLTKQASSPWCLWGQLPRMCLVEGFHVIAPGAPLPFPCPQFWYKREGARPSGGRWWAARHRRPAGSLGSSAGLCHCALPEPVLGANAAACLVQEGDQDMGEISGRVKLIRWPLFWVPERPAETEGMSLFWGGPRRQNQGSPPREIGLASRAKPPKVRVA